MARSRRYAAWAAALAALVAGAAGCGGGDSEQPEAGGSTAPATSSTSSPPPTSPSATGPTAPATPSLTPAAGIQLTEASSAVRAPVGWKPMHEIIDYASGAADQHSRNSVDLVDSGDISGGAPLDAQAQSALQNLPKGAKASRYPDVQLDGVTAFHIHYTVPGDRFEYDTITTIRNGRNVGLDFILDKKNAATNPGLIASVLATFQWIA